MKVVSFAGGQTHAKSGLGLVGMPLILSSTAARGHQIVLLLGGGVSPGRENFQVENIDAAKKRKQGAGTFGAVSFKASTKWSFCPSLFWKARKQVKESDFVSLHSLYCFPIVVGYVLARFYGKPYGIWPHGVLAPFQRSISHRKKWLYNTLIAFRILNNAAVVFYSAIGERDEAAGLNLRAPSVVIPHGFEAEEFHVLPPRGSFRKRYFEGHTGPLVLFLARLNAKKGLDTLAEAMALVIREIPDARLAIVGPADPRSFHSQVEEFVARNGIKKQTAITGSVDPQGRLEAFSDADVFVLPSEAENFGFSIFESMASRVPVVVSDTVNYAAEIAEKGAGFSVPRDPAKYAAAIIRLLRDPVLHREMGENGEKMARSYSWESNALSVERTIQSILKKEPIPADIAGTTDAGLKPTVQVKHE